MSQEYTVELNPRQYTYLKSMAEKYGLPDESKAARCLIDYAVEKIDQEESIFNEVRCLDCG